MESHLALMKCKYLEFWSRNGAGKTEAALEMIEGLTDIDSGSVKVNEIDVSSDPYAVKRNYRRATPI